MTEIYSTEKLLSSELDSWPRVLIGITGRKGHGKDTAAEALVGFEVVKFAGALKMALRAYMAYVGLNPLTIERMIEGDLKEQPADCFRGKTPRYAMQTFGTEWGRDTIGSDIWTEAFRERAKQFERVVCTDVRFPNEAALIRSMSGVTVRIVRPNAFHGVDFHASERFIDDMQVDHEILNTGSISELRAKMRELFFDMTMKLKNPKDVEVAQAKAAADNKRYEGCCEICDVPEDCRMGRQTCELSGEYLVVP